LRSAHNEQIFNRHKPVLDAMGDQAAYIGPIGAGTIAKLVHNCTSAVMGVALAEVFTMGIKAASSRSIWGGGGASGDDPAASMTRPISACGGCTRMSGSAARSACRCASPTCL
jgi:hypothetical protein